jgi:DNA-binding MarR family transcriptional regulator
MFEDDSRPIQQNTRDDLLQITVEHLLSVVRKMHKDILPQSLFLSPPQARLVSTIAKYKEEGISVKELAKKSTVTPGAITQFVDILITKGMVTREADPNDRRIVRLKITPAAESQLHNFQKDFLASAAQTFNVLSIGELKQLIDLLDKVNPQSRLAKKRFRTTPPPSISSPHNLSPP